MDNDVLVLGSGPAGLAVGRALAARGLRTRVLDPDPERVWPATYGSWRDHLPDYVQPAAAAQYPTATVSTGGLDVVLARPYTRLDTASLQRLLRERAIAAGVTLEAGRGEAIAHDAAGTTVGARRCAVLVDATGSGGAPALFQTAYGILAEVDGGPSELRWMDFSHRFGDGSEWPSFLYALPLPDGRAFLEETSLARRGGAPFEQLEARLGLRLAAMGVTVRQVHAVEQCRIALDRPVPPAQRTIAFGAAAGMVHPASGFSLARVLAAAEPLADAIVGGLARGGPTEAASDAWSRLWPAARRRRWAMYRYGARAVSTLGADDIRVFFAAFFCGSRWGRWLDDELTLAELAGEMMAHFARLPSGVRARLIRGSLQGREGR